MKIINKTQSICPICHKAIRAYYIEEKGKVLFIKDCPQHGNFKTLVAESAEDYKEWINAEVINIPPKVAQTMGDPEDNSCPLNCGTCSNHLQTACCVLIDITDRCNQHCPYCFAKAEKDVQDANEPSLKRIEEKLNLLLKLGEERPFNLQLSGGEPTVRDDLPEIIMMAKEKGFEYIQINTNGRRLAEEDGYAQKLKDAGASVIFMQFDGTRDDIYLRLRGEPLFDTKCRAMENCGKAGLAVTLVPTIVEGVNVDNIGEMMDFMVENVNVVKGIHFQPVSFFGRHPEKNKKEKSNTLGQDSKGQDFVSSEAKESYGDFPGRITMFELLRKLERQRPEFSRKDYLPITTGHPLCCFYSTYIKEPDGSVRCTMTQSRRETGISCCNTGAIDKLEVIRKDRDFVLNKWEVASHKEAKATTDWSKYKSSKEIINLNDFLKYYRQNAFTVTGMAFQDAMNIDAERVKRCRVQVLSEDDRLIPFCAYNSIYRK